MKYEDGATDSPTKHFVYLGTLLNCSPSDALSIDARIKKAWGV
jgi:hypothetical protein